MKKKILILLIITVTFIFAGYKAFQQSKNKNAAPKNEKKGERATPVTAAEIEKKNLTRKLVLTGELTANLRTEISAKITGLIERVNAETGRFVRQDEILIRINDTEYQEQLKNSQVAYKLAQLSLEKQELEVENLKKQIERTKELFKNNLISRENYENLDTKYKTAEASLQYNQAQIEQEKIKIEQAKINLGYTVIKAPFSGFIEEVYLEKGTMASTGKIILSMVDIDKIKIITNISENYYNLIKQGTPVKFTTANDKKIYSGNITNISPVINQESRTAKVEITVFNKNYELKPGMSAEVTLNLFNYSDIPAAPIEVLYKVDGKSGVYLVNEDKTSEFIQIEPAVIDNGFAGFIGNDKLTAGKKLVLLGGHLIKSGDKVKIESDKPAEKKSGRNKKKTEG